MKRLGVLALALALSGCAVGGREYARRGESELTGARLARAPAEISFLPTAWDKQELLSLKTGAVALSDESGQRRWAAGLKLPSYEGPFSVRVLSRRVGTFGDGTVLYPELVFLDEQYREVSRVGPAQWRVVANGLGGEVFINESARAGRYLLVRDSRPAAEGLQRQAESFTQSTPIFVPIPGGMVMIPAVPSGGNSANSTLTAAPVGEVEVSLHLYRLRKVGEK